MAPCSKARVSIQEASGRLQVLRGAHLEGGRVGKWSGVTGALVSGIMWITAATASGGNAHRQD